MQLFNGYCPAIITPMNSSGTKINFDKFRELINFQIENGAKAIVFLGTTGEPSTLSDKEKIEVIKFAVGEVGGRVPVIAGAGSNCTKTAINLVRKYEELGVDGILSVTPYYNKCTQSGLIKHYEEIAKSTILPIILYNVPSRTGVNMLPETVLKLSKVPNIVGLKEASGNIEQIMKIIKIVDNNFSVFSGDDALTYSILAIGGKGVISVAGNIIPDKMNRLCESFFNGNIERSRIIQLELLDFIKALFIEVNPIPIKMALNLAGFKVGGLRLPLTSMQKENQQKLKNEMKILNLI